jgi:hypothetical protein
MLAVSRLLETISFAAARNRRATSIDRLNYRRGTPDMPGPKSVRSSLLRRVPH